MGVNVSEIFIMCRGNFFKTMPYASTSAFGSSREGNDSESEPGSESSFLYLFQARETSQSL